MRFNKLVSIAALCAASAQVSAQDVLNVKTVGYELARDVANATLLECRKQGYQVSVVVVDRSGNLQVAVRDELAPRFTLEIAERKANVVIMSGINSGEFSKSRTDIKQELNHIEGLIMMQGGVLIESGGARLGAVGVSGAPGGDKDEACAKFALKKLEERLEFAE
ncbi:MAG: heme-binding protein [Gammaproteobacteria bacterium]|nr:heme-binding protein [Gammaproteobacteria bacterium]